MNGAVTVDVVSDVVCPWCFIGKRKLEQALAELAHAAPAVEVNVRWHPFQLNPHLPVEGLPRATYVAQKFGGASRASHVYARVADAGEAVGIAFAFDRIVVQPNTFDAHRLVVVSQELHMSRAVYTCRRLGIDADGVVAPEFTGDRVLVYQVRERFALVFAWLEVNIRVLAGRG